SGDARPWAAAIRRIPITYQQASIWNNLHRLDVTLSACWGLGAGLSPGDGCPVRFFMENPRAPIDLAALPRALTFSLPKPSPSTTPTLRPITARAALDGMELVCEAIQEGARPAGVIEIE